VALEAVPEVPPVRVNGIEDGRIMGMCPAYRDKLVIGRVEARKRLLPWEFGEASARKRGDRHLFAVEEIAVILMKPFQKRPSP
jgi:hypothetical protein